MVGAWDREVMQIAPDTVLVLMNKPMVIRKRMASHPERKSVLQTKDIEFVLKRFDEQKIHSGYKYDIN